MIPANMRSISTRLRLLIILFLLLALGGCVMPRPLPTPLESATEISSQLLIETAQLPAETATPAQLTPATPVSTPSPVARVKNTLLFPSLDYRLDGTPAPIPALPFYPQNVSMTAQQAVWGRGSFRDVAWSPDGKILAVGGSLGVQFLEAQSLQRLGLIPSLADVSSLVFSADGKRLVFGDRLGGLNLWNLEQGAALWQVNAHPAPVDHVAFSQDGQQVLSSAADGGVKLWDSQEAALLAQVEGCQLAACRVGFDSSGRALAWEVSGEPLRVWDVGKGELVGSFSVEWGLQADLSPDGRNLAAGSFAGRLVVWGGNMGLERSQSLSALSADVSAVRFDPQARGASWRLATGEMDGTLRIWEVQAGRANLVDELENAPGGLTLLAFSPDGKRLAGGDRRSTLWIWDLASKKLTQSLPGEPETIEALAFSADGRRLASASVAAVNLWEVEQGRLQSAFQLGDPQTVSSLAISSDGLHFAAGYHDGSIWIGSTSQAQSPRNISGHLYWVTGLALNTNGSRLVSLSPSAPFGREARIKGAAWLWNMAIFKFMRLIDLDGIGIPRFSPDGLRLAIGGEDGRLRMWTVEGGPAFQPVQAHDGPITCLAFRPDGTALATGGKDGGVRLWNTYNGRPVLDLPVGVDAPAVLSLAFSPDGRLLAAGAADHRIRIWDTINSEMVVELSGHSGAVTVLAFSPDGLRLASGGQDGLVRLWGIGEK